MSILPDVRHMMRLLFCALCLPCAHAGILVNLDATALPIGPLPVWTNSGSLPGNFLAEIDVPIVTTIDGVKGVTFDGVNDWYIGPTAPSSVVGNNSRTVIAWVYNPMVDFEETVVGWGRREGPNGTLSAFFHGNHDTWGGFAGWGTGDVGWTNQEKATTWTCCVWVYDGPTSSTRLYTDGVLSTNKVNGPLNTYAVNTAGGAIPFTLGTHVYANGARGASNGSLTLARLKIHDTALSGTEVAAAYTAEAGLFLDSFTASPAIIHAGGASTLSWLTDGAFPIGISPAVTIPTGSKSVSVSPAQTTTYTLTATVGGVSRVSTVTVSVLAGAPTAVDLELVVSQNGAAPVILSATDPNPPPGGLVWQIIRPPASGVLSGTAPALTYTPAPGFSGTDSFDFSASDGINVSNTATVTIRVNPPPANPAGVSLSTPAIATSAVAGSFVASLSAADPNFGETHTYQLVAGSGSTHNALFSIVGNQLIAQSGFAGQAGGTFSIRVRVTDTSGRTFEESLLITAVDLPQTVVIHEISYDPPYNARSEFIELHNPTSSAIDLSGWRFTAGIDYAFPPGTTIAAGGFAVVAMDPAYFLTQFGFLPHGPFLGKLSSDGERVTLSNAAGVEMDRVEYQAEFPWPVSVGGGGASMELIHPSLDNNLGGSWRGSLSKAGLGQLSLVPASTNAWFYRAGSSFPASNWRASSFIQDSSWITATTPVGFGSLTGLTINTQVAGMLGSYNSLFARKTFTIAPGEKPDALLLRYTMDDGIIVWINGTEVARRNVAGTALDPALNTLASSAATEGLWYDIPLTNGALLLNEGVNVIAVRTFNRTTANSDLVFDVELIRQARESVRLPSPGLPNTTAATNPPPQIRQVNHAPKQPKSTETMAITAKLTDPQGIGSVSLRYQLVSPGAYIPARFPRTVAQVLADPYGERPVNPAFENSANWTSVVMRDDGAQGDATAADGTFTATIPAQPHRTLVRYRIVATDIPGASVQVPYADDASLNFACFVYDGVPDYAAASPGRVWPKELLTSLPIYHWIIRNEDMLSLQAYETSQQFPNDANDNTLAARRAEEWEGAFVYDGIVYDHVGTRLRGGNSRYGDNEDRFTRGKRHYKFSFNAGNHFQARDQTGKAHPQKWKSLAVNKMFGNKGGNGWGMPEEIGSTLWSTFGVPSADTHWFHFRVIDGAAEAPDPYNGDFWGIQQVVEEYESTFLDARGMTKGNLYKMSDWIWDSERQRRYQSPDMVTDGSEFNNIRDNLHGGQTAEWLQQYLNYDKWYRYSAVAEAIRHYDLFPYTDDIRHSLKNVAWYFEPTGTDPTRGRCWWLPYDWDASFGPNWNNGWEHANNALYGWDMTTSDGMPYLDKPAMKLEHRNVLREFRDLIWQPDQINNLIDDRAAVIAEISKADQDRWRNAPTIAGYANDDTLVYKARDMKNFCFTGWSGATGPTVTSGGRAAYLTNLADAPDLGLLPQKPVISYSGSPGHPINGLSFQTQAFSDPQGAATFGAMAWRIGAVEDPAAPAHDPAEDFILEYTPVWESGVLGVYSGSVAVPAGALKTGRSYRARVRMMDNTKRWSHWSEPYQFTAIAPDDFADLQQNLMITEVMYNPAGPAPVGGSKEDYEYIELCNISSSITLDLTNVRFTKGIDFDFAGSAITSLAPGACAIVVKNLAAFESRHGTDKPVAGVWSPLDSLANNGEQLKLSYGAGLGIRDFTYDDAAPWPTAADGGGHAMILIDPASAPDHALAASWSSASASPGDPGLASRFDLWLSSRGAADPAAEAIPGMSYVMMYALGADLVADPQAAMPTLGFIEEGGNKHLTLSYRRRLDATDVACIVETSTSLGTWQHGPADVETVPPPVNNGDGTETITVRVIPGTSDDPARFIRLRVEVAE